MKIAYFANHGNTGSDDTEAHIARSLEKLGCEVVLFQESTPEMLPKTGFDLLLIHKGGFHVERALKKVEYSKVFWYFDKVWNKGREEWFSRVLPLVDLGFLTDGDYAAASPSAKLVILRQGIGDSDVSLGKPNPRRYRGKIAFLGGVYKGREGFIRTLKEEFVNDFTVYNDVFNRDLYDLCASIPVIVAPPFPSSNRYWSSRIYMVLGSGGFLVHPVLVGLAGDGLIAGEHYAGYRDEDEMLFMIRYYLEKSDERDRIRLQGYRHVTEQLTYTHRCRELLREIHQRLNIGIAELGK